MGEECGSHPCCARMGHPFSGWYVLPADVFVVSQVPFLRFAAEMYLGRPFCVLGMLPEKQMRAARDDVGWGRDVVPTLAQPPQGRRPVLGDPGIAQGWGIHFLCPYVFPADAFVVSQVPFLRFAAEMYLGHPFFVLGVLPECNCGPLGMTLAALNGLPGPQVRGTGGHTANIAKGHLPGRRRGACSD